MEIYPLGSFNRDEPLNWWNWILPLHKCPFPYYLGKFGLLKITHKFIFIYCSMIKRDSFFAKIFCKGLCFFLASRQKKNLLYKENEKNFLLTYLPSPRGGVGFLQYVPYASLKSKMVSLVVFLIWWIIKEFRENSFFTFHHVDELGWKTEITTFL